MKLSDMNAWTKGLIAYVSAVVPTMLTMLWLFGHFESKEAAQYHRDAHDKWSASRLEEIERRFAIVERTIKERADRIEDKLDRVISEKVKAASINAKRYE